MMWLFLLGVLVCAIVFPKFRIVVIAGVILVAGWFFYEEEKSTAETSASKTRIAPSEVEFADMRLLRDFGSNYKLEGRVRNQSPKYTLSHVELRITFEDCTNEDACDIVYQANESPFLISVPPGQVRDFEITGIGSYDLRIRGSLRWHYEVTELRGA